MKLHLFYIISLIFCASVLAQQDPQYTQYIYNMSTVNPAYVKDQPGVISGGLLYRNQWQGIEGAPKTANAFINFPTKRNVELSINYVRDEIGDAISVTNDFANIDFAYITQISSGLKLAYGLKAGFNSLNINALDSNVSDDPAFNQKISESSITFGVGLFLYGDRFYAGLSAPNVLPQKASIRNISVSEKATHLYGIAGYVYEFSEKSKLKPSIVAQQVIGSPFSFSTNLNYLYANKFEIGASYRFKESVSAIAGFQATQNIRLGYAYDYSLNDFNTLGNGSHEIIITFDFDLLSLGKNYVSPRFY